MLPILLTAALAAAPPPPDDVGEGPDPIVGAALVCAGASGCACLCASPTMLGALIPGAGIALGILSFPAFVGGGMLGTALSGGLVEWVIAPEGNAFRLILALVAATLLAVFGAGLATGTGLAVGLGFDDAALGVGAAAAVLFPAAIAVGAGAAGAWAIPLLLEEEPVRERPRARSRQRWEERYEDDRLDDDGRGRGRSQRGRFEALAY